MHHHLTQLLRATTITTTTITRHPTRMHPMFIIYILPTQIITAPARILRKIRNYYFISFFLFFFLNNQTRILDCGVQGSTSSLMMHYSTSVNFFLAVFPIIIFFFSFLIWQLMLRHYFRFIHFFNRNIRQK